MVPAEDGHVAPGMPFLVRRRQQLRDLCWFAPGSGQAHDERRLAIAAATHRLDQRRTILIPVFRLQEFSYDLVGGLQDLICQKVGNGASAKLTFNNGVLLLGSQLLLAAVAQTARPSRRALIPSVLIRAQDHSTSTTGPQ